MPRKQPVEKPRARPTDVQITGRRWGKTNADVRHWSDPVMVGTDRRAVHSLRRAQRSRLPIVRLRHSPLLYKNVSCAATGMAVLREIHFGGGGVVIGKRAHALDHVEANLGNFLRS